MVSYVWFRTNISIQLHHSAYATSANKICTNRTEKAKQTLACIRSSNAMLDKRPWPNGVASHRELKTSDNLRLRLATTLPYLGWLAITCVNFNSAQIFLQVNEIFSPSGHPTPSRRKLVWVLFSLVRERAHGCTEMAFCKLFLICVHLRVRLATHRKSTCASLHCQISDQLWLRLVRA